MHSYLETSHCVYIVWKVRYFFTTVYQIVTIQRKNRYFPQNNYNYRLFKMIWNVHGKLTKCDVEPILRVCKLLAFNCHCVFGMYWVRELGLPVHNTPNLNFKYAHFSSHCPFPLTHIGLSSTASFSDDCILILSYEKTRKNVLWIKNCRQNW